MNKEHIKNIITDIQDVLDSHKSSLTSADAKKLRKAKRELKNLEQNSGSNGLDIDPQTYFQLLMFLWEIMKQ